MKDMELEPNFPFLLFSTVQGDLRMKSQSVTIQMKATEHYFPVVLFIKL